MNPVVADKSLYCENPGLELQRGPIRAQWNEPDSDNLPIEWTEYEDGSHTWRFRQPVVAGPSATSKPGT